MKRAAVIGGGPAGLMAAEQLRAAGCEVDLFEAKGSVGRKFLIAGKGGLNLTHGEPRPAFDAHYRERAPAVGRWLDALDNNGVRAWAQGLGIDTYVGSSGRVFPLDRKAAPLLRGWVRRLRESGVRFHVHHRWCGWQADGALRFAHAGAEIAVRADATVFALGGGSWPQLGSDGAGAPLFRERGIAMAPLQPANCGFDVAWSPVFAQRFAGAPLKPVVAFWRDGEGSERALQGECVVTANGIEGSLIYALSADLREAIKRDGIASLHLDLVPGRELPRLRRELSAARGKRSIGEHLRRAGRLDAVRIGLLREALDAERLQEPDSVAATLKRYPITLLRPRPLQEAISSAGGVRLEALNEALMLRDLPGTFCAGEMLDWEAPTGGYLLTACLASGWIAGCGAAAWLAGNSRS